MAKWEEEKLTWVDPHRDLNPGGGQSHEPEDEASEYRGSLKKACPQIRPGQQK